jgi:ABC-type multidrug transport system fused ATPase/permease subunit
LSDGALKTWLQKFIVARMMTLLFSALVAFVIFIWARKMYGAAAGLAALALYVFNPNIIAHSQLVTTDIYAAGTILFAIYSLWKFARERTWANGLLTAFFLGLSLVAKYTSIALLPLFILALVVYDWPQENPSLFGRGVGVRGDRAAIWKYIGKLVGYTVAAGLVSLLVINIGFLFNRSFTAFGEYRFRSDMFQQMQKAAPTLAKLPVPVPYPYLEGLDWVLMREQSGFGYGRIYFLGQLSEDKGFPGYYFVAFLLKEPIATQIIIISALIAYILHKKFARFRQNELFLFIPAAFFVLYFNFFYNTQIGIRFYLVIFPLLYVFAGSFFESWQKFSLQQKMASYALFGFLLVSAFSYYPNFLTYFNEIVWDRKTAYKYLADSNIDWEQGKLYLQEYLTAHPQADYAPLKMKPGFIVVSVNDLVGVTGLPGQYDWLRENFEPVDSIANEYLVYQVSVQDYENLCARTEYCTK